MPCTSTAQRWRPSTRCSARLRDAPAPTWARSRGANLIKLHRHSSKVSYLVDPDFDADPHPALLRSIKLNLRSREIESSDYAASANPPVPHRKETFLLPEDPRRAKFERLTRQEERAGLLDESATIGTRTGWAERLREWGVCPPRASARPVSDRGYDR
jgi:DNA phosphorothioation-associated putative methyltransferase